MTSLKNKVPFYFALMQRFHLESFDSSLLMDINRCRDIIRTANDTSQPCNEHKPFMSKVLVMPFNHMLERKDSLIFAVTVICTFIF